MLKENYGNKKLQWSYYVLILILMEHAQRDDNRKKLQWNYYVLILILMEHAQRA